jgi:hypothetical protein
MRKNSEQGQVWGRPEALDTIGRLPGRRRRRWGIVLGVAAIAAGGYLGLAAPARDLSGVAAGAPAASPAAAAPEACFSIGVSIAAARIPAEWVIAKQLVVRLSRANPDGSARLLVPEAPVLTSTATKDGTVELSVLVRSGSRGDDTVELVNGASADKSLSAAALYDADWKRLVNDCRGRT